MEDSEQFSRRFHTRSANLWLPYPCINRRRKSIVAPGQSHEVKLGGAGLLKPFANPKHEPKHKPPCDWIVELEVQSSSQLKPTRGGTLDYKLQRRANQHSSPTVSPRVSPIAPIKRRAVSAKNTPTFTATTRRTKSKAVTQP